MKDGVLVVDKPAGPTSFEVVRSVGNALKVKKAGHAGTLDPAATGVLVICLGEAVKLQHLLAGGDKSYLATVVFGVATDTEDAEGRVVATGDPGHVCEEKVRAAAATLVGELDQKPPMYSAVRVGGRRLHEAARQGEEVDRPARRIRVFAFDVLEVGSLAEGKVVAKLAVRCGKGTYVRSLAVELGRRLLVPAHLLALRRTEASGFSLERALPLAEVLALGKERPGAVLERVIPLAQVLPRLPLLEVDEREVVLLGHGQPLMRPVPEGALVRAVDGDGRLVALLEPAPDGACGRPVRVFPRG